MDSKFGFELVDLIDGILYRVDVFEGLEVVEGLEFFEVGLELEVDFIVLVLAWGFVFLDDDFGFLVAGGLGKYGVHEIVGEFLFLVKVKIDSLDQWRELFWNWVFAIIKK